MAARSFSITVLNYTGRVWNRVGMGLAHGVWSDGESRVPPEQLLANKLNADGDAIPGVIFFASESQGAGTGTEGFVDYRNDAVGTIHIYWDNPFVGSNSFSATGPNGFTLGYGDPGGNDASITLTIRRPL